MLDKENNTVSLVLGSGGARGLAHIGVIHWLEENGYKIQSISGCSMGALIGGVYAAGKLDVFEQWVRSITKVDIVALLDLSWRTNGLVKGDKIINTLTELVGDTQIEDLKIKYTAIAADILNEKEIWINSGSLFDAIRASISLPLFFTPFHYNGIDLIDGGILNPVPIAPTFGDDTDFTIAVNLGGKLEEKIKYKNKIQTQSAPRLEDANFMGRIKSFIESFKRPGEEPTANDWGAFDIANKSFDAMQSTISRQKLAAYPPDFLIEIPRNSCDTLEFNRADEMIQLGYEKAEANLKHCN